MMRWKREVDHRRAEWMVEYSAFGFRVSVLQIRKSGTLVIEHFTRHTVDNKSG